jgi:hypothetical protein
LQTPPTPPAAPRLHVILQRDPATQAWQADLEADPQGDGARRHFDTLAALLAWLARLDDPPPVRGIR